MVRSLSMSAYHSSRRGRRTAPLTAIDVVCVLVVLAAIAGLLAYIVLEGGGAGQLLT